MKAFQKKKKNFYLEQVVRKSEIQGILISKKLKVKSGQ